jgi:transposase
VAFLKRYPAPVVARISELTIEIRHALDAHPDGPTFRSLFIAADSWLCAATMLSEIGDCRDRYPTYRSLAADADQCPVAVESGKSKHAKFRWACYHRLRQAFCTLADASRRHNPWVADIYDRARVRGASHTHATRILGRAWSQIIWRLWHDHDTYDPQQHTALQRLITAATQQRSVRTDRPHCHAATARRCRHRRLPAGQSAQRLTASRQTLRTTPWLTQEV